MKLRGLSIILSITLALAGCSVFQPQTEDVPTQPTLSTLLPDLPTQGGATQMNPPSTNLQNLIDKAREDLAQRLSIPATQINLVDATAVTWPDASLGCPQMGMEYAQVLTPGYLILLEYGNNRFEYHASRGTYVIYCENPTPPILGTPDNT
jgi:hypothetical protein